jgi:hypothetical protein
MGYFLTPELQAVFRFELFERSQADGFAGKMETLGLNYNVAKTKARIMAAISSLQNIAGGSNGSPGISAASLVNDKRGMLGILAFQMAL